jgi:hypothetical protein
VRAALSVLIALAAAAPASAADVRLSPRSASVRALAATPDAGVAVVDSGTRSSPFRVVRSGGSSASLLGTFGDARSDEPAIAAGAAGLLLGWSEPVSGGIAVIGEPIPGRRPQQLAVGTGTPALGLTGDGSAVAAYPDASGDTVLETFPGVTRAARPYAMPGRAQLSRDAPERRHRPLGVAVTEARTLVLDLIQTRTRTELRVLGPGAPAAVATAAGGLHQIPATIAAAGETTAVAYASRGRVKLATATGTGGWSTRTLPGAITGAPAVAMDGGAPVVVWARPGKGGRELYAWSGGRARRLTRSRGDDYAPFAAAAPGGPVFVAWTRRDGRRRTPLLRRLG